MNKSRITSLLLVAGCLVGHLGWAQQAPVAPLAPVVPVIVLPRLELGVETQAKRPAAPAPTATALPRSRPIIPEPVVILNGRYLASMNALGTLHPQQIDKLEVYKAGSGPMQWRSLTAPGILSLGLKAKPGVKLQARSLAAIKRGLGLRGPVRFEFNGAPLEDESLQILTSTIMGLDVAQAAPGTAAKTVVNIRSVPFKPAGPQAAPAQPTVYPPGSIIIRGLAHQ